MKFIKRILYKLGFMEIYVKFKVINGKSGTMRAELDYKWKNKK